MTSRYTRVDKTHRMTKRWRKRKLEGDKATKSATRVETRKGGLNVSRILLAKRKRITLVPGAVECARDQRITFPCEISRLAGAITHQWLFGFLLLQSRVIDSAPALLVKRCNGGVDYLRKKFARHTWRIVDSRALESKSWTYRGDSAFKRRYFSNSTSRRALLLFQGIFQDILA